MGKLFRHIYYLLNRRRLNRELEKEMAALREMMPKGRRSRFRSATRLTELSIERWGWMWLDDLRRDLAYGAHSLFRSPGFTVTAVLVLALGIGVNLAEFDIFNAVFHRLQVRDVNTLARFSRGPGGRSRNQFAPETVAFYREYNSSFSSIFEETDAREGLTLEGDPEPLRASFVSGGYFGTLGVLPTYGRLLDEGDCKPGAEAVAVLGYGYWQGRFGSDPSIVGRKIRVNGKSVQVVGIGPSGFSGIALVRTFLWLPNIVEPYLTGGAGARGAENPFEPALFGRLKPRVTFEAAESEFRALAAQLRKRQPKLFQPGEQIRVERIDALNDPVIGVIVSYWILLVMSVLFAACANLGNMLLARGLARQREIEIRLAIGAGPWRIVRQLMTENLLLASIGAVVALAVGRFAAQILNNIAAQPDIRLVTDWRLLAAAGILTLIAVSAFGLAPAIQAVRRGRQTARAGKFLVSFQVAISCALLILSSLLTRGMLRTLGSGVSIDYAHMIVADPALYLQGLDAPSGRQSLDDSISRVRRLPGVDGVTLASVPPFGRRAWMDKLSGSSQLLYLNAVDPSYFGVLRLRFLTGRTFLPAEQDAAIVSQSAARALWPGEQPLGKSFDLFGHARVVVGVVADSGVSSVVAPTSVEAYLPLDRQSIIQAVLVVHATAKPSLLSGAIRAAASEGDRTALVSLMDNDLAKHVEGSRNLLAVIGVLGTVATALAAAGIFGLIAFTVSRRTKEIGIRLALGASGFRILGTVLGQYVTPVSAGLLAGIAIVTVGNGILRSMLVEIPPFDLISYSAALVGFLVIAFGAALLPCRKALGIDPASVLRCD
jgi:predicted permease